jgi:soluble cytochrome b562
MTQGRFHACALSLARARHRGAATLAALALAVVVAGCGGGGGGGGGRLSKSEYEQRIQKDGKEITVVFKPLSKPPSSLDQLAKEIKTGQDKLREAAADLDGVTPPKEVEHDNDVLVAGLRKLADQLEPLRKGADKGDVKLVQKAVTDLQNSRSLKEAQRATEDMKKKGYKIGTLGS